MHEIIVNRAIAKAVLNKFDSQEEYAFVAAYTGFLAEPGNPYTKADLLAVASQLTPSHVDLLTTIVDQRFGIPDHIK